MTPKKVAIDAAKNAGKLIKNSLGTLSSENIQNKDVFDFVTNVDKESEQLIIDSIRKHFPDHEILAEESGKTGRKQVYRWIIDPLDGTTNFIHSYPNSAVSIALEENGTLILGVIYDPFRDELFYAEKGKGAFLNDRPIHVSKRSNLNQCLIATGFPFRNKDFLSLYWQVLSEIFLKVSGIRRTGSAALDLAHIACGRFDGFWELKLSPWDVAAGSVIIQEAGGKITDFAGENNHVWTGNVIASNNLVHDFLLEKVTNVFRENP
ncbi:inositol monophosphatase [candidate division KSB1 bacterium]|nr:inositol monophosphatase [candidate division KSB1 bacterium]MBL7094717.1 inositol monophosphatase [candidate division KSB1 bacterium]